MSAVPSRPKVVLAAALALACVAASAWAQEPPRDRRGPPSGPQRGSEEAPRSRGNDALSDSVRRFERSNRGSRVLSAERMHSGGREMSRIKAMDDRGRVRVYVDDPQRREADPPRRPPARDDHD